MSKNNNQTTTEPDLSADYKEFSFSDAWRKTRPPEYFEYRKMWDEAPRNKTQLDFPINVDIETTSVCNLACPMCARTQKAEEENWSDRNMTRDEYASIIDQCVEHGAKAVKLNYDGEPMAHKDIVWQIEYAKKKGIIDVVMNTNGTLLKGAKREGILKAGMDGVFISLDTVSPDIYEKQRIGATLGNVIDNIHEFIKLRNEKYPGCQIRLNMVIFEDPMWLDQFQAMKVMWEHLVDGMGYSPAIDFDRQGRETFPEVPGWWCSQPFQRMVLKVTGNVTVCCPDIWDDLVVGNWRKESLYDIWHGKRFKEVRDKHAAGRYHDIDLCRKCSYPYLEKKV